MGNVWTHTAFIIGPVSPAQVIPVLQALAFSHRKVLDVHCTAGHKLCCSHRLPDALHQIDVEQFLHVQAQPGCRDPKLLNPPVLPFLILGIHRKTDFFRLRHAGYRHDINRLRSMQGDLLMHISMQFHPVTFCWHTVTVARSDSSGEHLQGHDECINR